MPRFCGALCIGYNSAVCTVVSTVSTNLLFYLGFAKMSDGRKSPTEAREKNEEDTSIVAFSSPLFEH